MKSTLYLFLFILLFSCKEGKNFPFYLDQQAMIVNLEQDNRIEGEYLKVENVKNDSTISIKFPSDFKITNQNASDWMIGWGDNKPLCDAGIENLREIKKLDQKTNTIYLGRLLRGKGFPILKQRIVFWNRKASGFENSLKHPIIDTRIWPEFHGKSIGFGAIVFDTSLGKWVIIVNEVDTTRIQIYAAVSTNLKDWEAANNGKPILTATDFKNCSWAGKDITGTFDQTPMVSDLIRSNNKWHLFLNGYSKDGKRTIGIAVSSQSSLGPYQLEKNPILSPGNKGSWNDAACFDAKVKKYKEGFILFYDGKNSKGLERVGMASSKDLIKWENSPKNPVLDEHNGWRSLESCSEPAFVDVKGKDIYLLVAGVKKFKAGPWSHYISKRMYMDKSGNVGDTQLGLYLSVDGGQTFVANTNNPVFVNDYSNVYENDHLGGNFSLIHTDTATLLIYQAKSSFEGNHYNLLMRSIHH